MKKLKLFFAAFALLVGWSNAMAQMTDVTSTYIDNASFESDGNSAATNANLTITGWTEAQSDAGSFNNTQTRDKDTDNASVFGTKIAPADGAYYLFYRHGWNGDAGTTVTFTATSKTALPAGVYSLQFKYQQSYNEDSASKTTTRIKLAAKNGDTEIGSVTTGNATKDATFGDDKWSTSAFMFTLASEATVSFEFTLYSGGQKRSDFLLDDIRLLTATPATPVADNTADLYLYNEATNQYLSAGQSWGTHATVDNYGYEVTAMGEGVYKLKTQQYNKYLGGLYMDAGAVDWLFLETSSGSGKYYMTQDGYNYMTSNGAGAELVNVTSPTDASVWTIISKADRKTTALSSATIDNPSDVTFLIADANFSRNTNKSVWNGTSKTSDDKENLNLGGGKNENFCAESFHATFSVYQTLSGLEDGVYGLTAQGFYRKDAGDNTGFPYFYLGDEKTTFPVKTGTENNMSDASASFSAGLYTIDPIYVRVEGGSVELGAKHTDETYNLWCIWDNFQLKYYGDVTVAAVKMKASVDAYNAAMTEAKAFTEASMWADGWTALQSAITTNTLDLNDPGLTEDALNTATSNLVAANAAATASVNSKTTYNTAVTTIDGGTNVNLTSLIVNPSFESDFTGWTNTGSMAIQTNTSFTKTGNKYAEYWQPNGTKGVSQTVGALPAGIYTLQLRAKARGVTSAKLFVDSNEQAITIADEENEYSITFDIADKTSINIGFEGVGTGAAGSWFAIDNFRLTYVGTINDLTYTKATGKMGTDKSAAQDDAETTFLADKTLANYNALIAAISEAEASVANYASLKAAIDKANDVKDANNFVTAAATTAFQSAITTATNGWTDVTFTDDQATAQITTLGTAVSGWHANATGEAGVYMASTWGKTSENWWEAPYINTWSTEGDNDGSGFSVPFFEYYTGDTQNLAANTFTASMTGLENGVYEVELWARAQRRTDANFNTADFITMYVNDGTPVSIMNGDNIAGYADNKTMRLGRFTARGTVTDGTLTLSIDVKLGANVHWLSWRDIKYTKLPDNVSVTVTDAGYATYCSPYALDFSTSGLTAHIVTGATGNVLDLETVTSVPANTGVLLEGAAGDYDISVIASSSTDVSGNVLQGTTTEKVVSEQTAFVLMGSPKVGFYKNKYDFTVGANTAYLNANFADSEAREAYFFDGLTGVNQVENGEFKSALPVKRIVKGNLVIEKNGVSVNAAGVQLK